MKQTTKTAHPPSSSSLRPPSNTRPLVSPSVSISEKPPSRVNSSPSASKPSNPRPSSSLSISSSSSPSFNSTRPIPKPVIAPKSSKPSLSQPKQAPSLPPRSASSLSSSSVRFSSSLSSRSQSLNTLLALPLDLINLCLTFLPPIDLTHMSASCRTIRSLCFHSMLWKPHILTYLGIENAADKEEVEEIDETGVTEGESEEEEGQLVEDTKAAKREKLLWEENQKMIHSFGGDYRDLWIKWSKESKLILFQTLQNPFRSSINGRNAPAEHRIHALSPMHSRRMLTLPKDLRCCISSLLRCLKWRIVIDRWQKDLSPAPRTREVHQFPRSLCLAVNFPVSSGGAPSRDSIRINSRSILRIICILPDGSECIILEQGGLHTTDSFEKVIFDEKEEAKPQQSLLSLYSPAIHPNLIFGYWNSSAGAAEPPAFLCLNLHHMDICRLFSFENGYKLSAPQRSSSSSSSSSLSSAVVSAQWIRELRSSASSSVHRQPPPLAAAVQQQGPLYRLVDVSLQVRSPTAMLLNRSFGAVSIEKDEAGDSKQVDLLKTATALKQGGLKWSWKSDVFAISFEELTCIDLTVVHHGEDVEEDEEEGASLSTVLKRGRSLLWAFTRNVYVQKVDDVVTKRIEIKDEGYGELVIEWKEIDSTATVTVIRLKLK